MGKPAESSASPKLRVMFVIAATIMFALWVGILSRQPKLGDANEDGFSYVPIFYTTIICFPIGLYLLIGAIAGHGRYVRRARIAFFLAAGISLLVAAFLIVQQIADNNHGKVLGIQIGFRLDRQDAPWNARNVNCPVRVRSVGATRRDDMSRAFVRSCGPS